jgi:DNA (cytosine-5)-methyltransferase 1
MKLFETDPLLTAADQHLKPDRDACADRPLAFSSGADSFRKSTESSPQPPKLLVAGIFAGVGGFEEGFRQAGHSSTMLCEFDAAARHVLARRFHGTEITEDVRALTQLPDCNVLTAGFPCQDLSQVGPRTGIAGPNSGLIESVFRLLQGSRGGPQWVVLENVPFMLTLDGGRAIRMVTDRLETMGYSWAYRTIDARAFGLPQRRRRVVLIASRYHDPRPVLLTNDVGAPIVGRRGNFACGFYWTEGNTGLGWAVDAVPPLKGGSALHIPSPPAIWFPRRRAIAVPAIEDAERLQGFEAGWTSLEDLDPRAGRKRWRMVGNAVSVPLAKWLAERLTAKVGQFNDEFAQPLPERGSWPSAAWGRGGRRGKALVSEWPVREPSLHLASFLTHRVQPLSKKAASGFLSRLVKSTLRYEEAFRADLEHHVEGFKED